MFPGKTKSEEFATHVETEYAEKVFKVGKMEFTFKSNEGEFNFEYEFKDKKEQLEKKQEAEEKPQQDPNSGGEEGGDDEISFSDRTLSIRVVPYDGNEDGILFELIYLDEKKNKQIKYRYKEPSFTIGDDNFTNSKEFFEICEKNIKKLIKKLKKNI